MMPGIGFAEMVLLALVAMVVIGPKDLPLMMRKFGRFTGKMRSLAFEFKQGFDELGRQAELEELRKEVADLKKHTGMDELQKELADDEVNLRKDVDSAMAPASLPQPEPAQPASAKPEGEGGSATSKDAPPPAHPAAAANGSAQPAAAPVAPYAGLSADHPGYDAGEDFRIGGQSPEASAAPVEASQPEPRPVAPKAQGEGASAGSKDQPVKQDAPA